MHAFGRVRQHNEGTPTPTSFFWFLVPALAGKPPWSGPKSPRRVGTQANAGQAYGWGVSSGFVSVMVLSVSWGSETLAFKMP